MVPRANGVTELRLAPRRALAGSWGGWQLALPNVDDLVGEVPGRNPDENLLALLLAEERPSDRALVRDPALGRAGLGRADDRERLRPVRALDRDGRADLDVVGRVVLIDDRGVLDQRLERLDPPLDEGLFVLGVLVFG